MSTQAVVYVSYQGDAQSRFDRDYYVTGHMPLVRRLWGPYGLEAAIAFFPAQVEPGTIVVAELRFRDEAAMEAAFAAPETPEIMDDVARFTDLQPTRLRAVPL